MPLAEALARAKILRAKFEKIRVLLKDHIASKLKIYILKNISVKC
jgi:hypothetical protein